MARIDTRKVKRRPLAFVTLKDAMREAEALAAAERAGRLRAKGNWTLGQTMGHLAFWVGCAFDGLPAEFRPPPWPVRTLLRLVRGQVLRGRMPAGFRIGGAAEGTFGIEPMSAEEGLARLRSAYTRLENGSPTKPNPVFGPLTPDQWRAIHLRHAELHLGFFEVM